MLPILFTKVFELAGGADSKIVLLPHASGIPLEVASDAREKLEAVGFTDIVVIDHDDNEFDIADDTTCVYALGGDQSRLVERLGENGMKTIASFLNSGGLYAGTSAGTACVGQSMIACGMSDGILDSSDLELAPGLGLVSGLVTDQHFRNRNRFNRLMLATASLKDTTGIGIDEDTAVLIDKEGAMEVFGAGQVTVFEAGEGTRIQNEGDRESVIGMTVSCLSPGTSFELETIQFLKGTA